MLPGFCREKRNKSLSERVHIVFKTLLLCAYMPWWKVPIEFRGGGGGCGALQYMVERHTNIYTFFALRTRNSKATHHHSLSTDVSCLDSHLIFPQIRWTPTNNRISRITLIHPHFSHYRGLAYLGSPLFDPKWMKERCNRATEYKNKAIAIISIFFYKLDEFISFPTPAFQTALMEGDEVSSRLL